MQYHSFFDLFTDHLRNNNELGSHTLFVRFTSCGSQSSVAKHFSVVHNDFIENTEELVNLNYTNTSNLTKLN